MRQKAISSDLLKKGLTSRKNTKFLPWDRIFTVYWIQNTTLPDLRKNFARKYHSRYKTVLCYLKTGYQSEIKLILCFSGTYIHTTPKSKVSRLKINLTYECMEYV